MNVLITGASGFIGHALCNTLAEKGHIVKGAFRSQEKLLKYKINMDCVSIGEIGPNTDWMEALRGIDVIVHLAARVHVMKDSTADPLSEFRKMNLDATEHLAKMSANAGVKRFVFMSTVKVNGEQTENKPFHETDIPRPEDPYAVSKWEAEQALYKILKDPGLEVVILRPPLVYGPGVKANFLRLLQIVDHNIPLPFMNVYNQRSLIYLGNLVDAIITCCLHPNAKGETFLVSDGEDVSTPELIKMIAHAMNKKAKLLPFPQALLRMMGTLIGKKEELDRLLRSLCIDSSKIKKVLNWTPPFSMRDGINETVKWYKNRDM
jgi:nucleoside-diphosphate-sugar epimerase